MNRWKELFKKKESLLILILAGLILLVISVPTKKEDTQQENKETKVTQNTLTQEDYCKQLEERLEEILSCMDGVGKVRVMITLKDSGENIVQKDTTGQEIHSENEESYSWEEQTVYEENGEETNPYVINTYKPQVQGILIIAQGGDDPIIQNQIMQGVMALFGIESHKISIINME